MNFAAAAQSIDQAVDYLNKIPEDSPRRGQAELRAGQALWSAYLRALRQPEAERLPADKLASLKEQSEKVLTRGIARFDKTDVVDPTLASAVFSLAQICVEADKPEKAIEWLTHARFGPLTLVEKNDPAANRPGLRGRDVQDGDAVVHFRHSAAARQGRRGHERVGETGARVGRRGGRR